MRLSICNETYAGWPFDRVCADVAECGYQGIEVALSAIEDPRQVDEAAARRLGRTARSAGLEVVGLHWLLARPEGLHLTTPDDAVRRRTVDHLRRLAHLCAAMGGEVLVLGSPKQRSVVDGYPEAFARAAEGCRAVAETAHPLGVTLALEPLAPAYTDFLTTAEEAVRLIEAVDHPGCRLHLDAYALTSEREPPAEVVRRHGRHLVHFHANDTSLGGPGTGDIDFAPIAAALDEVGYRGWVSVEVFDQSPGGPAIARQSLSFLESVFG